MISVEEALEKILQAVTVLPAESKPLLDGLGQVIAEDIYAPFNVPSHSNSAMDGFAVIAADIKGASPQKPVVLRVKGEVPAGKFPRMKVVPGQCVRIMTGGIIPQGADTIVPVEDTELGDQYDKVFQGKKIKIIHDVNKGFHVRYAGEDISRGELVISKGRLLRPVEIGVLASLGIRTVSVTRRPVISILATGNELVNMKAKLTPGKLYNSNTYSVASQIKAYGGIPKILGIAKDRINDITRGISRGLGSDLIVTSGGVSVSEYDIVKKTLKTQGDMVFWRVRMKPGRPLTFGIFTGPDNRKVPHIGLPGNPVSCMLDFELFCRPAISKMMGKTEFKWKIISAVLQDKIVNSDGRRIYARVKVKEGDEGYTASLTGSQGSGVLTSMLKADGLAIVPETVDRVGPGEVVKVVMLE